MNRKILFFFGFLLFAFLVIFLGQLKMGFFETMLLFLLVGIAVGVVSMFLKR